MKQAECTEDVYTLPLTVPENVVVGDSYTFVEASYVEFEYKYSSVLDRHYEYE